MILYITIGILAVQTAVGTGGQTTGSQGTISALANETWGQFLLAIITLGLVGLAFWYIVRGVDAAILRSLARGHRRRRGKGVADAGYATVSWLLGIVAIGLVAYGLYSAIVLARYRRLRMN